MQIALNRIGLFLFLALSAFMVWFGWTYASVRHMLWFHAAAVPEALRPQVMPLYFALMSLIGASSLAVGGLTAAIALGPLRRGAAWAPFALAAAFTLVFSMAAVTAETLRIKTGAPTSWHIMGVLLAVTAAALATSLLGRRAGVTN